MGSAPGLYVYAVDRREVMATRSRLIAAAAARVGITPPIIRVIKSALDRFDEEGTLTVRQDIARVPNELQFARHVVIIITHEALKSADWSSFAGWHLVVDEIPNLWDHELRRTPAHAAHFQAHYGLERVVGTSFSIVSAKPNAPSLADYQNDATASTWANFHKRITSGHGVYVNIHDWREMALRNATWSWYSVWDIHELASFSEVWIVGNAFEHSVTYGLITALFCTPANPEHQVTFESLPTTVTAHEWAKRSVRIRYFAKDHNAGSFLWHDDASPYKDAQHRWADWIAANSDDDNHYWTANLRHVTAWKGKIPGQAISPKIAGSNEYRDLTTVSVCYSAKGNPAEISALKLFGITPAMVTRSREMEDLIQIVFRSSLRVADDTRPVDIRVYDLSQAEFLKSYFEVAGFPFEVDLEHVDIGLDDVARKSLKQHRLDRKLERCATEAERQAAITKSTMTKAEKERARKARIKAKKVAAGEVVRGRGRPRKAVGS
ncbi:hypothetical protein [Novosphingobium sp. P6W]|uniref:hypothetical protein n=1 Tax=Novosphingobium sp. P6W TaxID=1609758 RepID=UPI0005C2D2D9|nr:hypothetical protein [Novosphingobium sp. P6W]AXB77877.1 hypothetical protein TQ38_016315 [Novosphingobium sp. P6W]KIS29839.1 hypothetical protein TQ38_26095 [Novosphingobium sp. P6W]